MRINLLCVGKLKEPYLRQGCEEYLKRLSSYCKLAVVEVTEEQAPERLSPAQRQEVLRKEGRRLLAQVAPRDFAVSLEIEGRLLASEAFADRLEQLALAGTRSVALLIGGSLGLSQEVKQRADLALSFSRMTLPHQLMRLVILEQLYRAFRITRNEPYHK